MVRIAKRLVRYNIKAEDAKHGKGNIQVTHSRRKQYSCEKCGRMFGAWKYLHKHKVENHSY